MNVEDPIELLLTIHELLERRTIDFATYGGLALAAYGAPRFTRDTDLALTADVVPDILDVFRGFFHLSMTALENQPFGGLEITRLTVFGKDDQFNTIDLVVPRDSAYSHRALERALVGELRGKPIRLLAPEDFVLMKVLSTRERDITDAVSVMEQSDLFLDRDLIEKEVTSLARSTDHPVRARWDLIKNGREAE